jgi:hypothetical protein
MWYESHSLGDSVYLAVVFFGVMVISISMGLVHTVIVLALVGFVAFILILLIRQIRRNLSILERRKRGEV